MTKRKTHEQFLEELFKIHPNIEVLGIYKTNNTPILCKCKTDGHEWSPRPKHLLRSHGCPVCGAKKNSKNRTKTHEQFIEDLKRVNDKIKVLSRYKGASESIDCECLICGHHWSPTPHNLTKAEPRGCPKCAYLNFLGENNPRWNPELTDEERNEGRNNTEYKEWRKKVFERDNYTCQVTGEYGRLVVHHIYSYDKNKELRLEMSNGITILESVHKDFHLKYGYGNNTLEQWNEFINNFNN